MTASQKINSAWENLLDKIKNFDWFSLLIYEEHVAGLSIDDRTIRYVNLDVKERDKNPVLKTIIAHDLEPGIIKEGKVNDLEKLTQSLKEFAKKIEGNPSSVVLSIPSSSFFTTMFQFPRGLEAEQVDEALALNVSYVMPLAPEETYIDSERVTSTRVDKQEVFVAMVEKSVVDPYLLACDRAGFSVVATEPALLSITRLLVSDGSMLLLIPTRHGVSSALVDSGIVRFSEFLPFRIEMKENPNAAAYTNLIEREAARMVGYDDAEAYKEGRNPVERIALFDPEGVLTDDVMSSLQRLTGKEVIKLFGGAELLSPRAALLVGRSEVNPQAFLPALGSAERGILDRGQDTMVSLMPIGTEEAYDERRAVSFAHFLKDLTYGLAVTFLLILGGTYGLLYVMSRSISTELTQAALPQNIIELQNSAKTFNQYVGGVEAVKDDAILWSNFLRDFTKLLNPGMTIQQIQMTSPSAPIQVTLFAATNEHLLQYKRQLEESNLFEGEIKVPFSALAQPDKITFTLSLTLKDPNIVRNPL